MWCKWRSTSKELFLRFKDGEHRIWLESVCANPCDAGEKLCSKCKKKIPKPECQYNGTFPHGLVDGPYTEKSHIYDSPWYHKRLEEYGAPSEEVIALAQEAQRRAQNGQPTKFIHELGSPTLAAPAVFTPTVVLKTKQSSDTEEDMPVKKASTKKIIPPKPIVEPLVSSPTVAEQLSEAIIKKIMKEHKAVETMDDVLPVRYVSRVKLERITYEGVNYWIDAEREKLYHINSDGNKGNYVGQWDSALKIIQYNNTEVEE